MAKLHVLVSYGSRYGSTRIVAEELIAFIKDKGHQVDCVDLRKSTFKGNLETYDLVIAGSSIAMFRWVGSVKKFLVKCKKAEIATVVYVCSGMSTGEPEKAQSRYIDKVISRIGLNPVLTQAVGPVIDFRPEQGVSLSMKNRIRGVIRAIAQNEYRENDLMDLRDRNRFENFLKRIDEELQQISRQ